MLFRSAVQEDFVRAALMAREAGFDGVEVRESCYFTPFVAHLMRFSDDRSTPPTGEHFAQQLSEPGLTECILQISV